MSKTDVTSKKDLVTSNRHHTQVVLHPRVRGHFLAPVGFKGIPIRYARKLLTLIRLLLESTFFTIQSGSFRSMNGW